MATMLFEVTCQAKGGFGRHVHSRTSGNVVEHNRKVCSLGYGLVVLINSFLGRFIVVRNGYQYGIHSRKIIVLQRVDYGLRAVTADSQQDGNSSVDTFDNRFP